MIALHAANEAPVCGLGAHRRTQARALRSSMGAGLALALLVSMPVPAVDIPALPEVSQRAASVRPDLGIRRAALLNQRSSLRARSAAHTTRCSSVEEGSSTWIDCKASFAQVMDEVDLHIAATKMHFKPLPFPCFLSTQKLSRRPGR